MASSKADNISGFAIDRADMDMLLTKWFGGSYLDIVGWKEKAKKLDSLELDSLELKALGEYTGGINELIEDAKKWREHLENTGYIKELEEKAQKWLDFVDGKNINDVSIWKEKAEKWDMLKQEFESISS